MIFLKSEKKSVLVLFVTYMIANSFLLFNYNGIYWDDWVLYGHSFETINNMFLQAVGYAAYPASLLHYSLLNTFNGVIGYRLFTVGLLFLSGIFIYKILKNIDSLSDQDRFFIVLFILLAPLYSAKIALIDFPYTFYSTFFFFTFYLLAKNLDKLTIFKRILILMLFFASFLINSLLVFYAIVLMYMFYKLYNVDISFFKNILEFVKYKFDFILLPIAFFVIKSFYFIPSGLYGNYNKIKLIQIFDFNNYYKVFELNFIEPISKSLLSIYPIIFILFIFLLLVSSLFTKNNNEMKKQDVYLLGFGFLAFYLGVFAYIAVGKLPSLYNWASRFQLLLPLGFSFILYYSIQIISNLLNFKEIIKLFAYSILVISFIAFNLKEQIKYNIDWSYQQSIMENFRLSKTIKNNNTFIVDNQLGDKLIHNRRLGFYQLNGMSEKVFGKDDKFFVSSEKRLEKFKSFKIHKQYNFSTWEPSELMYLTLRPNPKSKFNKDFYTSLKYLIKLKYLELVNKKKFLREIKTLVKLEFKGK